MPVDTKTALLDCAQELTQTRGLNAFSFKDLARKVGIRTASVHHHFPTKGDLGRELVARYRERFRSELASIDAGTRSARRKLRRFTALFRATLREGDRLCLCGMLAAEYTTLPAPVRREVRSFYEETEGWLASVLRQGRKDGVFEYHGAPGAAARTFLAALEGAMITARAFGDERRLEKAARWVLASALGSDRGAAAE
jgi:TetR/AcrR family transcriptional repressor of nem operon